MSVRFAVSPIAWLNDDMPQLGAGTSVSSILADAQAIGFSGIELGGSFPRNAGVLRALLEPFGLALAGGWFGGALLERGLAAQAAAVGDHLALLAALDCRVFIYAETSGAVHGRRETSLAARPRLSPGDRTRLADELSDLADLVAAEGLALAYHPHLGTVIEDGEDLEFLLAHTDSRVGLTLDTGHAALAGIDPTMVIRAHPSRIAHVHAKDVRRKVFERVRRHAMSFLDGVVAGMFTVPGDGDLDWGELMRALAAIDYRGWIVVEAEQDPRKADPATHARLGLDTLATAARIAGLLGVKERLA
ncbi:MAG TPA: myo-inosose-2 dehydratase [Caulobacteraceae bacterium]